MKAGKEMDALVEEEIFHRPKGTPMLRHPYSTSIEFAWDVVDELRKRGYGMILYSSPVENQYHCEFSHKGETQTSEPPADDGVVGDSAPHAICLSALKKLGCL